MRPPKPPRDLPHLGWREWVALPELGIPHVKAKLDTGARTSALHAYDIRRVRRGGRSFVRFRVHPFQRDSRTTVEASAPLVEVRRIRSSTGQVTERPVIRAEVELLGQRNVIELTLVPRDEMGFRMLLGREAVRNRFVVDPGRSFVGGKPPRSQRGRPRRRTE